MRHGIVRHEHACRQIAVEFVELECAAEESIGFLLEAYRTHRDEFYLYLANGYERALGRKQTEPEPSHRIVVGL